MAIYFAPDFETFVKKEKCLKFGFKGAFKLYFK